MSARDDYPPDTITVQWAGMCDEIDALRARNNVLYQLSNRVRDEAVAAAAELVGLREQLARQAPVIEAANRLETAVKPDDLYFAGIALHRAVRALSVPAPPEATEVTG